MWLYSLWTAAVQVHRLLSSAIWPSASRDLLSGPTESEQAGVWASISEPRDIGGPMRRLGTDDGQVRGSRTDGSDQ